jgi:hypothetical protein
MKFRKTLLGAAIVGGVLAACNDMPTRPTFAVPEIAGGVTAAKNTIDSKDVFGVRFDSVKEKVGSSRAVPEDTVTYRYETVLKMTAKGVIMGYNPMNIREFMQAYPTGLALYPPGTDMFLSTFDGATGGSISFPGGGRWSDT